MHTHAICLLTYQVIFSWPIVTDRRFCDFDFLLGVIGSLHLFLPFETFNIFGGLESPLWVHTFGKRLLNNVLLSMRSAAVYNVCLKPYRLSRFMRLLVRFDPSACLVNKRKQNFSKKSFKRYNSCFTQMWVQLVHRRFRSFSSHSDIWPTQFHR